MKGANIIMDADGSCSSIFGLKRKIISITMVVSVIIVASFN